MQNSIDVLVSIALELLEKYENSQEAVIWEYSGSIKKDEEKLVEEISQYRERIKEAEKNANLRK